MLHRHLAVLLTPFVIFMFSCKKKNDDNDGSMANATVALSNDTSALTGLTAPTGSNGTVVEHGETYLAYPATTYSTKFVQIYLVEDLAADGESNEGNSANIWINPDCETLTEEDGSIRIANGSCDTTKIDDYFALARTSDKVNADLNSQKIPITPGTFRYVRVQLCDNTIDDDNIQFASSEGGLATVTTARTGNCIMPPVEIDPPLEVAADETVEVSLSYDLSQALYDILYDVETETYKDETAESCATAETGFEGVRCVRDIPFTASAKKG